MIDRKMSSIGFFLFLFRKMKYYESILRYFVNSDTVRKPGIETQEALIKVIVKLFESSALKVSPFEYFFILKPLKR